MTQVTRRELFPGVWLRTVHTDKFKSSYLSLTMLVPLERERAAANALLFPVLRRGTREHPDMESLSAALDELYAEGEQYGARMQEKDMEAERLRTEASDLESRAKEQESAAAVLEGTIAHNRDTIERVSGEMTESDTRAGSLAAQSAEQKERAAELEGRIREENDALEALLEKARSAAERADGRQSEAEALRGQEAMAAAAAADARAEAAAAAAEETQIRERSAAAEADRASVQERLEQARQESRDNRRRLEDARDDAAAAANVIAGHSLRMEERRKKAAAAGEKKVQLTMDAGALENRIRLLTEMEKEYEGFSKAVKLVCQAHNRSEEHTSELQSPA